MSGSDVTFFYRFRISKVNRDFYVGFTDKIPELEKKNNLVLTKTRKFTLKFQIYVTRFKDVQPSFQIIDPRDFYDW